MSSKSFSGMCYSPDLVKMFSWSTDGETFMSGDCRDWVKQDGLTVETDEGAFVAGREPSFVPWSDAFKGLLGFVGVLGKVNDNS